MGYYGNVPKVGEKTRLTKDELVTMLNREIEFGGDRYAIQERRIAELQKRRTELQEANNRMLERARTADRDRTDMAAMLETALDELTEVKGERERDIILHLEQQTWARIELNKATEARDYWIREATTWAKTFAKQRQNVERYEAQMNVWVDNMKAFARGGIIIDLIVCGLAFLVIAGVLPPVFR